jgi:DNA polymerase III delta prime subunit
MERELMTDVNNEHMDDTTHECTGALDDMPPSDVMVIYPNPEKKGATRLGREEYMPYATSRILFSGPPGSGKRNVILNIVRRILPKPNVCHLVHHDPNTEEYDILSEWGIPVVIYGPHDIPTLKNIEEPDVEGGSSDPHVDHNKGDDDSSSSSSDEDSETHVAHTKSTKMKPLSNPLIIVDEVTKDMLNNTNKSRLERLVNHACTHRNATLLCSIQSATNIVPAVRRGFNHFALWKQPDEQLNKLLARRTSITPELLNDLFGLLRDPHEFIWIDLDSPIDSDWRYRVGLMNPIMVIPNTSSEYLIDD